MTRDEIAILLDEYRDGTISDDDAKLLARAINEGGEESGWVMDELRSSGLVAQALDGVDTDGFLRSFTERLSAEANADNFTGRIEGECRRLSARSAAAGARNAWWRRALAAAACLALAAGTYVVLRGSGRPALGRIVACRGEVVLKPVGSDEGSLVGKGALVREGDSVLVRAGGSATVAYSSEKTSIDVASETEVSFGSDEGAKRVRLERGTVKCTVAKQPEGRPIRFLTDDSVAEVLGTELSLSCGSGHTRLEVSEGSVRLTRTSDGASAEVSSGEFVDTRPQMGMIPRSGPETILSLFDQFSGPGAMIDRCRREMSDEHATVWPRSVKLDLPPGKGHTGIHIGPGSCPADWSGYEALVIEFYNPEEFEVPVFVSLSEHAELVKGEGGRVMVVQYVLPPGELTRCRIDIGGDVFKDRWGSRYDARRMDNIHITGGHARTGRLERRSSLFLSGIYFVKMTQASTDDAERGPR